MSACWEQLLREAFHPRELLSQHQHEPGGWEITGRNSKIQKHHPSHLILAAASGVYRNFFFFLHVSVDFRLGDIMASVSMTCRQMKSNEQALVWTWEGIG